MAQHDWQGGAHHIRYTIPATGRYFLRVGDYQGRGGSSLAYVLKIDRYVPPPSGPGDPMTVLHSPAAASWIGGLAHDAAGDVFASYGGRLDRMPPTGQVTTAATGLGAYAGRLAIDGFGNLLSTNCEYPNGVVWRISPTGERSRFYVGRGTLGAIAVGPNGDVWVFDSNRDELWRFDPLGAWKNTIASPSFVHDVAFSPSGILHFTAGYSDGALYQLIDNTPQRVLTAAPGEWFDSFAFDRDGYIYIVVSTGSALGYTARIVLCDPQYRVVADPFAQAGDHFEVSEIAGLSFARDASGAMTSRLLGARNVQANAPSYAQSGAVIELNRDAIRAPGARVGVDLLPVDLAGRSAGLNDAYADTLRMQDAPSAVTWTIEAGSLPPGVSLDRTSGILSGVPADTGAFTFSVRATSGARFGFARFTISVAPAQVSVVDVTNALLGAASLSPALVSFLDRHGNNNGMLDAGDLRAYLRALGQLPSGSSRIQP
jgi:hypothetical protein